ncbi:MAG TPA: hypothetical protein VGI81_07640 [Tepidisphaeraceae bacterium]|jgi:hypothetical protein
MDPIIEVYKRDVDRTLIRENLRLTVDQRLANLEALLRDAEEIREAMRQAKSKRAAEHHEP